MGEFVVYSVKVALCLVMFYVFYKLLLSRTTFHTFNRCVLLSLVLVSLLLPFVHITFDQPNALAENVTVEPLLLLITETESATFTFSMIHLAVIIYFTGVIVCALRMVISYFHIYRMFSSASQVVSEDDIKIYIHSNDVSPFSWFRNVVISENDYTCSGRKAIITHEKAHAMRVHSADILLCNLLTVVQWFNPAAWLLKAELQDVHEYEADENVLKNGIDATGYQLLLVRKAVGSQLFAIANNLSKDSLKKRIKMMKTKRTNRWECMKALVMLPLSAIAVVAFASPKITEVEHTVVADTRQIVDAVKETMEESKAYAPRTTTAVKNMESMQSDSVKLPLVGKVDNVVYDIVEKLPSFPGGSSAMMAFLRENIKYPKEAENNKEQGSVIVRFVVNEDGSITNTSVLRSVSPSLDAEALRVVGLMPKWEPGMQDGKNVKVRFALPVSFGMTKAEQTPQDKTDGKNAAKVTESDPANSPLVIIDGKNLSATSYKSLDELNPHDIEKMTVIKGEEAIRQYGESGKNGVVVINTKTK